MNAQNLTCPVCAGSGRQALDTDGGARSWPQYAAQGWMACRNCGGQSMSMLATGKTYPRRDTGEPCRHEFIGQNAGRCYTIFNCKHCPERYDIDSGD